LRCGVSPLVFTGDCITLDKIGHVEHAPIKPVSQSCTSADARFPIACVDVLQLYGVETMVAEGSELQRRRNWSAGSRNGRTNAARWRTLVVWLVLFFRTHTSLASA
jgi:hypothetical protein